jgi:pimeloyl-ACP methyl ester carboxylesterase
VAAPLAESFEVHAFDWPGYGISSRPRELGGAAAIFLASSVSAVHISRTS